MMWHNGGIDGFNTHIAFLPVEKLGVVVLTNLPSHPMPEIIAYRIFERALRGEEAPWVRRRKDDFAMAKEI